MDEIKLGIIDVKSLSALQVVGEPLEKLINYLKTVDPELKQHEATLLAAVLLEQLPTIIQSNAPLLNNVRESGTLIKQKLRS